MDLFFYFGGNSQKKMACTSACFSSLPIYSIAGKIIAFVAVVVLVAALRTKYAAQRKQRNCKFRRMDGIGLVLVWNANYSKCRLLFLLCCYV